MGRISEKDIEKVIEVSNIVDVISEFVPLKSTGRSFMGVCPFHGDKGPSLSVSEDKQLFHCFGCGASGNVIGFMMKIRSLDFIDAVKYLADRAGIPIETENENPEKIKNDMLKEKIFEANIQAARFFFNNLKSNTDAIDYFKNREIDRKTLNKFGLGYSLNSWNSIYNFLKSKGFEDDIIEKAGLALKGDNSYYDRFRNRVMFPVFDIKGRVVGFGGRVLDQSKPKYLNSPETPVFTKGTNLYGLNFVKKSGLPESIIVVEGYMDCISLHQHGINNAVASLGTALTQEQAKLLKRHSKKIYICYDADAAGQTATLRGLQVLEQAGCEVRVVSIPVGKDPDEYLKSNGAKDFLKLVKEAILIVDFRIQMAKSGKNLKDTRQKSLFVKEVAEILSGMNNEIDIQLYATKVFDETGISVDSILGEINSIKSNKNNDGNNKYNIRNNNKGGNIYNFEPAFKKAERSLLALSLMDNEYFNQIKSELDLDDYITPSYRIAAKYVYDKLSKGEEAKPQELLIHFEDENDISDVTMIFGYEIFDLDKNIDIKRIIMDYIKTIKRVNLENRINDLSLEIKKCEEKNDLIQCANLSQELINLQKQLTLL